MKPILEKYVGKTIGVNLKAADFQPVKLLEVVEGSFSIQLKEGGGKIHYPLAQIISILEFDKERVMPGSVPFARNTFQLVVQVNSGVGGAAFVGVGVSM